MERLQNQGKFDNLKIDDVVLLGKITTKDKVPPIEWIVVSESKDSYMLLSKDVLFTSAFGDNNDYANSTIRKRILSDISFIDPELSLLAKHPELGDYVFILSEAEADEIKHKHRKYNKWWWLRSPYPGNNSYALMVDTDGSGNSNHTYGSNGGVRPAILIAKQSN